MDIDSKYFCLDRRKADRVSLDELNSEWEMKTITSALKNYFRYVVLVVVCANA